MPEIQNARVQVNWYCLHCSSSTHQVKGIYIKPSALSLKLLHREIQSRLDLDNIACMHLHMSCITKLRHRVWRAQVLHEQRRSLLVQPRLPLHQGLIQKFHAISSQLGLLLPVQQPPITESACGSRMPDYEYCNCPVQHRAGGVADGNDDAASYEAAMPDSAGQQTVHVIPGCTGMPKRFISREECMHKMKTLWQNRSTTCPVASKA